MQELEAIISSYQTAREQDLKCVLATVVHVEGSSYRRAGARMLIDEIGRMTGAISGGCLEGDALRKALYAMHQKENRLVIYDTSDEDDAIIGAQLGCNGIIQVLFEYIDYDNKNPLDLIKDAINLNEPVALVCLFDLNKQNFQHGTVYFETANFRNNGEIPIDGFKDLIREQCRHTLDNKSSSFTEFENELNQVNVFIQYLQTPLQLVIVGAGNDAVVLSELGQYLGWKISITDGRPTHANEQRFSASCQVIVTKPEKTLEHIEINDRTFFVLLSHNYNYDIAVLKLLLNKKEIPYIGILGPLKKYERMLNDLKSDGISLSQDQLSRIYAPVGLEIGAETPEEIALSVLAEIQAIISGKEQNHLRGKKGPIHDPIDNKFKINNHCVALAK
jgi:xanthine/CO dehydrogenase XdhC/CoxF family maturation factor